MSEYAIGLDLGGTSIKAALVERDEGLLHTVKKSTEAEQGPEHILDRIAETVREVVAHAPELPITGIGVGTPGNINLERTTVSGPPNFPGWDTVNLRADLYERLEGDWLILIENDANVAGLGSAYHGAGRPFDSFLMVTLGTGVGGCIIHHNKIFRGATGGAGEIGHMTIDYEGPLDRSGVAGAIEGYLGQRFLSRYGRYRLLNKSESLLHQMAGEDLVDLTPRMLYEAAQAGDQPAREVLAWAGHKLGCVLGSAINLLDIRKAIVGGGISGAGDFILEPARQVVWQYVKPGMREGIEILQETLGNEVGTLGAARLIFQHLEEHGSAAS